MFLVNRNEVKIGTFLEGNLAICTKMFKIHNYVLEDNYYSITSDNEEREMIGNSRKKNKSIVVFPCKRLKIMI